MSNQVSRRHFLRQSLAAGTALTIPGGISSIRRISAVRGADIVVARGAISNAVRGAIDGLGGINRFVRSGQRVVLKPNMSFPNPPEWGTTTHPEVVKAVAEICLEAGASRVAVIDQPLRRPEVCLRRTGMMDTLSDLDRVNVVALTDKKFYEKVSIPDGRELRQVDVAQDVLQADVLINLPVAKSHSATGISFGMKNLMGLVWDREYFHQYIDLNQGIADLSTVIQPDLILVDATRPLITAGPGGPGEVIQLDTIIAGTDPVAVDSYTVPLARWYGQEFEGTNVKYIQAASASGLGEIDISKLNVSTIDV